MQTQHIETAQYTWLVSPEYIELRLDPLVIRITNRGEKPPAIKAATTTMGESVAVYGGDDMKLYFERKDGTHYVKLFHGRRNIMNYADTRLRDVYNTLYEQYRPVEHRELPHGAENAVTFDAIETGNAMTNFHDEFSHGRYYKTTTYEHMPEPKKNPQTRALIHRTTRYKAKVKARGGTRRHSDH